MGRPPIGKTAMTGAERTRLYRLKFAAAKPAAKPSAATTIATLQKELLQAKQELAAAKAHIAKLTDEMQRVLAQERKQHAAAAKPKTNRPPLPPDEARERTIKGLRTRVRNLEAALNAFHLMSHMPRETRTAIDWVMQPDQRSNAA